ncbi:hypothetical protein PbJCM13498_20240 [Prolixibacter bellariivorans]|uniref:Uncharacterized protein n=1 Tax=Prolixibacter bellariivorans TaxID=314319 RepID=A0A5M4AZT0_9BACT|nr:hypothetical protein PbJCM13498_20240 [Prolixibacter bellariivorans]
MSNIFFIEYRLPVSVICIMSSLDDEKDDWFNREMRKRDNIIRNARGRYCMENRNIEDNEKGRGLNNGFSLGSDAHD